MRIPGTQINEGLVRILVWVAAALALGSLVTGMHHAYMTSIDFQWSPARLLWRGVNPYEYVFRPDHSEIILAQAPNYGHLLYLMLWPYAVLDWTAAKITWCLTNLVFLGGGLWMMSRTLTDRVAREQFIVAALLLCIGFTARNVLANGQQTLLMFIAMVVFLLYRERPLIAGLAMAVLLTKYSFGLQIVLLAFVLGYYRAVAVSIVVTIAAIVAFGALGHAGGISLVVGPVMVARVATAVGFGDLLSLGRRLSGGTDPLSSLPLVVASVLFNLGYFGWMMYRLRGIKQHDLRTTALLLGGTVYLSLGTIYHLKYDYLTVMVGLYAFVLTGVLRPRAMLALIVAHFAIYWMLPRHESLFEGGSLSYVMVTAMVLVSLGLAVYSLNAAIRLSANLTGGTLAAHSRE